MDIQQSEPGHLPILFEKRLTHSVESHLVDFCDLHDLIATVHSASQEVIVYRINGQIAFRIPRKSTEVDVSVVKWKPDGSLLGVGWTDGTCGVYSGENGKLLSQMSIVEKQGEQDWKLDLHPGHDVEDNVDADIPIPTCIAWTAHVPPPCDPSRPASQAETVATTEEWFHGLENGSLNGRASNQTKQHIVGLTDSITRLDVTAILPRLSAIPAHGVRSGPDGSKFSTQMNVDGLLDTDQLASSTIDTLVTAGSSGYTNLFMDDSVKIGSCDLHHRPVMHASHPMCGSQAVLSGSPTGGNYHLHHIDLPLDSLGSSLLHVVATNTKRIQNLVSYITQSIRCLGYDFTTGMQFPTRLINNISEELSEKGEDDIIMELYHLAVTGSFTSTMIEWLSDTVKETNHKRWDLAVNTMYTNIQNHLFINLVPALDRLSIAASALRGHARLHDGTSKFVAPAVFTSLMDDVDSVRLVAQKIQLLVMSEHRQFRAFSRWLRAMIEIAIVGAGSKGATEVEERETPNLDYSSLLAYIKHTLPQSKLASYTEQRTDMAGSCSMSDLFSHPLISNMKHENIVKALESLQKSTPEEHQHLLSILNLPALTVRLAAQARLAIDFITEWQSTMLSTPVATFMMPALNSKGDTSILDMRMFPSWTTAQRESVTIILALSPSSNNSKEIFLHKITRDQSKECEFAEERITIWAGEILDGKLVDDQRCVVLMRQHDQYLLLLCKLGADGGQRTHGGEVLHSFAKDTKFEPMKIIIGGRKGKLVCVVFDRHSKEWKMLDLSASRSNDEESQNDEMEI